MVWQMILLQVITFGAIVGVLHLFFGDQLKVAMKRLQILHQESLEKEEILNREIERVRIQAQNEIARSKEEGKRIVEEAKKKAQKLTFQEAEAAQGEAKKIVAEASKTAKNRELEILAGVEQKAAGIAVELIKHTFRQEDQKTMHLQLIHELIEELKKVDKTRLAVKTDSAVILTSMALSEKDRNSLKEILSSKLGHELSVEEKVDASLIMGLVIKLGGLVVDGSLENKLKKAVDMLKAEGRV